MASSTSLQPSPVTVITYAVTMVVLREMPAKLGFPVAPRLQVRFHLPHTSQAPHPTSASRPCPLSSNHKQLARTSLPSSRSLPMRFPLPGILSPTSKAWAKPHSFIQTIFPHHLFLFQVLGIQGGNKRAMVSAALELGTVGGEDTNQRSDGGVTVLKRSLGPRSSIEEEVLI